MSDSPNRQAVVVGLFITAGIAMLIGGVLTIGNLNDTFTRKIGVTTIFDEVNGLQVGSNVWYSGLKVGVVDGLSFHGASQVKVDMRIDVDATPYIKKDALAKVSSDGLIGNKIVVLYDGTPEAAPIQEGDALQVGVVVSTEDIMATLQKNNTNILAITGDLKTVTAQIAAGEGSIGKLLKDDALYTTVSETMTSMNGAAANARSMTASMSTFASKLNREGSLPNELVTDETTYASLTASVTSLQATAASASELVGGLKQGMGDPNSAIGTLLHDQAAGGDMKATLDNLNRATGLLSEDLEAVQHNFLLRGFFKKKEKEEKKKAKASKSSDVESTP